MSELAAFAEKMARAAAKLRESGATDVCEAQAEVFLRVEHAVTPKRTGALADSEHIDSIGGGGSHAIATMGPHKPYAKIRNDGGTITRHKPGSLGTPAVGFFGHSVTQRGTGYVERAEGLAAGAMRQTAEAVIEAILDLG